MPQGGDINVAVVGGGIAGLTTALRLSQRGYKVTLYEEKPWLGGDFSSHRHPGSDVYHDVYPHIFSNFYVNLWDIVEKDLGLRRDSSAESDFAIRSSFKFVRPGHQRYMEIRDAGSLRMLPANMFSGVAPPFDIFLWSYSMLDMLAHAFNPRKQLSDYSVSGFVQSRAYATERVVALHDFIIMVIWSVHGADTSASSYRNFLLQAFRHLDPLLWLLKGDIQQKIIGPLEQKLRDLGCKIHLNTRVTQVEVDGARVTGLKVQDTEFYWPTHEANPRRHEFRPVDEPLDYIVLAVPPKSLGLLAETGEEGHRIVDRVPRLAEIRRLNSEPIPTFDLYFTRKLPGIPAENVAMIDSSCELTYIDLSQLWDNPDMKDITVLTVATSDYWALPGDNAEENAYTMIKMLHRYVPQFDPGTRYGESPDIDWERSHYQSNRSDLLFLNQVGSEAWRPDTHYQAISNLFFAGDLCNNKIDMATLEAAVTSGLNAAIGIQKAAPLGAPIEIRHLATCPENIILLLKLLLAPSAYAAKWWLTAGDAMKHVANGRPKNWTADLASMMRLPYAYAVDWMEATGSLWGSMLGGRRR